LSATLKQISWKRIFYQFIITNILNPKVALFFVAFLLQFIDVSRGNVAFFSHLKRWFAGTVLMALGIRIALPEKVSMC